ncbi:MAG: ChbG/HpnK family deacetylase [Planctomycetes bacterium]|nr:ChbG/HpnK family deacetylase [Planctomycetota bacterium]
MKHASHSLVINADDGALDADVDRCLLELAEGGLLKSVSVLATTSLLESFVKAALDCGLGLGLHVNLVDGRALGGPYRTLTNPRGEFLGPKERFWILAQKGAIDPDEVATEVRLQWDRLVAAGARPRHVDGHNHVHVLPDVYPGICAALAGVDDIYLRVPDESECEHPECAGPVGQARALVAQARWLPEGWRRTDRFVGLKFMQDPTMESIEHLAEVPAATTEWMVHPGGSTANAFRRDPRRAAEAAFLADPRTATVIARWGYRSLRFEDLP